MARVKYKISARATILLGREGVSKADGAMVELIKNTYDADADICFMCIDKQHDCIYLYDNGTGMDFDTIVNCWMLIGTANKRNVFKSKKNRIKSGEKGIGRFALDRLGSYCTMYTKSERAEKVLKWTTNWSDFENTDKTLDEMEAEIVEIDSKFEDVFPEFLKNNIDDFVLYLESKEMSIGAYETGTLFVIKGLRDNWNETYKNRFISGLGTLLPPKEQSEFFLCTMKNADAKYEIIENSLSDDYDYKIHAVFDGNQFMVEWDRNEFDLKKIPNEVFAREEFSVWPYRRIDFENQKYKRIFSIKELLKTDDEQLVEKVKQIGAFSFDYVFLKLTMTDDSKETFYYKEIGKNRSKWLAEYGGIKIYRDNFFVRPYGDPTADAYDWLGLDARKAKNPASISHENGGWHVRNKQGQGTVFISRVTNEVLLDKSSREGIIENEYFFIFKNVLTSILEVFERDRAHIGKAMRRYSDETNEKEKTKEEAKQIAVNVLNQKKKDGEETKEEKLAKAVQYYEEEREDLISEIQQLKVLATSGLLTSTVAHDLKGINAILVSRVNNLQKVIERQDETKIERHLSDLMKNDLFLKSWLTIVATQARKDRRTRKKSDVYQTVSVLVNVLQPILTRKKVNVELIDDGQIVERKIFKSDFESVIYNLIINSIEAFEKCIRTERSIRISMHADEEYIYIQYDDNGPGISEIFTDPYEIFIYGKTSKKDKDGNDIGTGMGMYIVASTLREYNAVYTITNARNGFGLNIRIPRGV